MNHRLYLLLHILMITVRGKPGNIVRDPGAFRGVGALLTAVVGLLSCGKLREDGDGTGGRRGTKHT